MQISQTWTDSPYFEQAIELPEGINCSNGSPKKQPARAFWCAGVPLHLLKIITVSPNNFILAFFSCFVVPDSGSTIFAHGPFPCPGSVVICRCWSHKWKLHKSNHPIFSGWKTTRKISNQPIHPWYAPDLAPSSPLISAASPFTKGFAASHVWAANVNRTRNCCQKNNPVIEISWSLAPSGPKTQQPIVFAYYIPIYIYSYLMMQSPPAQSTHHCWFKVPSLICGKKKLISAGWITK